MCRYNSVLRKFMTLLSCLAPFIGAGMSSTNAVFQSDSLERLMQFATREEGIYTTFNPYLGNHGSLVVGVTGLGCIGGEFATLKGCIASLSNESDMVFKLSSLPLGIQGVEFQGGRFDLSSIPSCEDVRYFAARCSGLSVGAQRLCALFPYAETMILDISGLDDIDLCLESLMRMKNLRRLELSCNRYRGALQRDLLQKFLQSMPQLERCELSVCCELEKRKIQGAARDSKYHTFEMSELLETCKEGVVEVPAWGNFTDVTVRMRSPSVRLIALRLSSGNGFVAARGLNSLTLDLHNVVPSGCESLIDSGELRYRIHIDKTRKDGL